MSPTRLLLVAASAVGALLLSGCATNAAAPGSAPNGADTPAATETAGPASPDATGDDSGPFDISPQISWIDGGHALVVTTYGSSSCPPVLSDVTADGQLLSVTLGPSEQKACTADLAPRGTYVAAPEGLDPATVVKVTIDLEGTPSEVTLPATTPGASAGQKTTATWLPVGSIALVTWGASNCVPHVDDVTVESATAATVSFTPISGPCTRDLAPRVTFIGAEGLGEGGVLTLNNLDGAAEAQTVTVQGTPQA